MFNTFQLHLGLTPRSSILTLTDKLFSTSIHRVVAKKELAPRTLSRKNSEVLNKLGKVVRVVNERGATRNVDKGFKFINYTKEIGKKGMLHEKQIFVIDLETLAINNVEAPYIMGTYIINKRSKSIENVVYSSNLLDANSGNSLLLKTLDFIVVNSISSAKNVYVFAHNGAKFDSKVLLPIITSLANNNIIEINNVLADGMSTLYEIRFRYKGKMFVLRDSIKLLGASVANLREIYLKDTTSRKIDIDMQAFQNWFANNQGSLPILVEKGFIPNLGINKEDFDKANVKSVIDYISIYCIIDCKVVALSLQKFSNSLADKGYYVPLDSLLTISSVSIKVFTTYFYNKATPIASIPAHTGLNKFIKNSYIGGRTEVLGAGLNMNNVYHFDIPGMYAQCMNMKLPYGNPVYISGIDKSALEVINTLHENSIIGFFKATVTCPSDLWLPVLGNKVNGKLTFNTGTFSGTWTSYELELALEIGYNIKLSKGYIFLTREILSDYSSTITAIKNKARVEGDVVTRAIAKLLRNSLYGKFAASYHDNTSKIVRDKELAFIETAYEVTSAHNIGNDYWLVTYNTRPLDTNNLISPHLQQVKNMLRKFNTSKPTNIAISATITSHGRIMLYKLWLDIMKKGGTLLYSDTDSVFASFPEAPYGKTFRGFVWPEDIKGNDRFNRVLFIAPKIYYLEMKSGLTKFAVKGVGNTRGYTYDDVAAIFINKEKLVFNNQLAFKNSISKGVIKGITVNNNLTKVYDMFNSVKREWVWIDNLLSTQPVENKESVKALSAVQEFKKIENKKILAINLRDHFTWNETIENKLSFGTQNVNEGGDVTITMNITDDIEKGLYHTTATLIANSRNMENDNVKRIIVTLQDADNNIFKTVIQVNVEHWTNYSIDNLYRIINEKITQSVIEYSDIFNPNIITFKVRTIWPIIISEDNNIEFAYNLSTTSLASKTTKLQYLKEQIELIAQQEKLLKESLNLSEDTNISAEEFNDFKLWKKEVKNIIDDGLLKLLEGVKDFDKNSKEFIMYNRAVTGAFYKTFEESGRITLHSFAEKIIDFLHSDRYTEKRVKDALSIAWTILSQLTFKGFLATYKMKTQDIATKATSLYDAHTFFINHNKSPQAAKAIDNKFILSKVSLSPIKAHFPEGFSKDIAYTLNKLNSTPILLNTPYLSYLSFLEYEDLYKMLDLKLNNEIISIGLAWANSKTILISIAKWYKNNNKRHFYMKYIHDFRGRLYPELTHVSHISHKFLRPLFIPKDSPVFTHEMLIDRVYTGKTDNKPFEIWYNIVMSIKGIDKINLKDVNSAKDLHKILQDFKNGVNNWNDIARVTELVELRKEGHSITPAPIEYDAKASVLQHAAAVSGNEKILAMLGILEIEGVNKEDIYLNTANKIVSKLEEWLHQEVTADRCTSDTIVATLEALIERLKGLSSEQLRTIAKKPLITKAYNSTDYRVMKYVWKDLKDFKVDWRGEMITTFIIALKGRLTDVIMKEITLMKQVQGLIENTNIPYGWSIAPNSDFVVYCNNPIKETKEVVLKSPLSGYSVHTNMNVLKQGQNKLKNRNRIFVNIIHSLDALHIALIIKHTDNYILPIHDAILVHIGADIRKIQETINTTFKLIHDDNNSFKRIIKQLQAQTGNVRGIVFQDTKKIINSNWVIA